MVRLLLALALLLVFGGVTSAQLKKPGDPCDSRVETCWARAAVAPYHSPALGPIPRAKLERAFDKLITEDLVPHEVDRREVRALVLAGQPTSRGTILPNDRITRMTFAGGQILSNIVAETEKWGDRVTKEVTYYQMTISSGSIVIIGIPDVCGNVFIIIVTPQGVCVEDKLLCDANCEQLKAQVSS